MVPAEAVASYFFGREMLEKLTILDFDSHLF